MNIEKMQEEFETFALSSVGGLGPGHLIKGEDGKYLNFAAQCYFDFWAGSRSSLVVTLPSISHLADTLSEKVVGARMGIEACRKAIESVGIKVTP